MRIKLFVKKFPGANLLYIIFSTILEDIRSGRLRTLLFVGLGNFLPDLLIFGYIRPFLWKLAGSKIASPFSSIIRKNCYIEVGRNLVAGRGIQINRNVYFNNHGSIILGNHVRISEGCKLVTDSHKGQTGSEDINKNIVVGNNCLLYVGAILTPGSQMYDGSILTAGSVLHGSATTNTVYWGNPARKLMTQDNVENEGSNSDIRSF